jgi:hypothetical protein
MLLGLLLSQAVLSAVWSTCTWGPLAANHHRVIAALSLGGWALTVASAGLWLVPRYGTIGAAESILLGDFVFKVLGFPIAAGAFYKTGAAQVYRHVLRGAAFLTPYAIIAFALSMLGGGVLLTFVCLAAMAALTIPLMMKTLRLRGGGA